MPVRFCLLWVLVAYLLGAHTAVGSIAPSQSCPPYPARPVSLSVILLIDKTYDASPTQSWLSEALDELVSMDGVAIRVGSFSNASGRNGATLGKLLVRASPPDEAWLKTQRRLEVARITQCQLAENERLHEELEQAIKAALNSEISTATRSDIAASLAVVAPAFKQMPATRALLIVVSDGLEHGAEQDFYKNQRPRRLDVPAELRVFHHRKIVADLSGIQVVWTGLGMSKVQLEWASQGALIEYWRAVVQSWGAEPLELASVPTITPRQALLSVLAHKPHPPTVPSEDSAPRAFTTFKSTLLWSRRP